MKQFTQPREWDEHKNESITVGSAWRRFWEHGSAHYHELDIAAQVESVTKKKRAEAYEKQYGEGLTLTKILGQTKESLRVGIEPDNNLIKIKDKKALDEAIGSLARKRPQLNFPHIIRTLKIPNDILIIRRKDLEAVGINIEERLKALRGRKAENYQPDNSHPANDQVASTNWAGRTERGLGRSTEL